MNTTPYASPFALPARALLANVLRTGALRTGALMIGAMLPAPLPAQQGEPAPPAAAVRPVVSAAEQQFRDAWWAESGQNDLEGALRGYLQAAVAEGPAAVRARALLFAGRVQQRLGKADAALATFKRVVSDHATERETVAQAREHLRELTAVDLRQDYDEWYERRLFGEEVQLVILGKLEAMAQRLSENSNDQQKREELKQEIAVLRGEVLAFGKGAVPALRKTCDSGHETLREYAIEMLFELGELPPVRALVTADGWTSDAACWLRLLEAASPQHAVPPSRRWHRPLLVAALAGPDQLTAALLQGDEPHLLEASEVVTAITLALLRHDNSRDATLAAITAFSTPLRLRPGMEEALTQDEMPLPLSAQQWLEATHDPLRFSLRFEGVRRAAALLHPQDGELLETILGRLEAVPADSRSEMLYSFCAGLDRLVAPQQVPWTLSRLRRALVMATWNDDAPLAPTVIALKQQQESRALLAEALLGDPAALLAAVRAGERTLDMFSNTLQAEAMSDEREGPLLAGRWQQALLTVLQKQWPAWPDADRTAALELLPLALRAEVDKGPVVAFLRQAREGASEPVRSAIDAVLAGFQGE